MHNAMLSITVGFTLPDFWMGFLAGVLILPAFIILILLLGALFDA